MTLPPAPDRWTIDLANTERMEESQRSGSPSGRRGSC